MSEEEIIEKLNSIVKVHNDYLKNVKKETINEKEIQAIQGLLDLYNKEKEKNRTLETLLQGNLYQMYSYYKELASKYQANSISKDKIREKIKELVNKNVEVLGNDRYEYAVRVLQELLEE